MKKTPCNWNDQDFCLIWSYVKEGAAHLCIRCPQDWRPNAPGCHMLLCPSDRWWLWWGQWQWWQLWLKKMKMDWKRWKDRSSIAKEVARGSSRDRGSGWMSWLAIPRPSCVLGGDKIFNMLWVFCKPIFILNSYILKVRVPRVESGLRHLFWIFRQILAKNAVAIKLALSLNTALPIFPQSCSIIA